MGDEFIRSDTISEDTTPETGASLADAPVEAKKRRWRKPLLLIAPVILIVGALAFYLHGGRYEFRPTTRICNRGSSRSVRTSRDASCRSTCATISR